MNPLDTPTPDDLSTHSADNSTGSANPLFISYDAPTLPGTWAAGYERVAEQPEPYEQSDPVAAFDDFSMPTPIVPSAALNMEYFMELPQARAPLRDTSEALALPRRGKSAPFGVAVVLVIGALVMGMVAGGVLLRPSIPTIGDSGPSLSGFGGFAATTTATAGIPATPSGNDVSPENTPTVSGSSRPVTPIPMGTATATPVSTRGVQPSPAATATATPVAPRLVISPTQITTTCAVMQQYPPVQVQNTGGGLLTWQAASSDPNVQVQPASGKLSAGASQNVTLSNSGILGQPFTVNFTSNGGSATLTVTCQPTPTI